MTALPALASRHRTLALLLLLAALCVKALVPAGYMATSPGAMVITVTLCDGETGHSRAGQIVIPMEQGEQPADKDCAWSLLAMASLDEPPPAVQAHVPLLLSAAPPVADQPQPPRHTLYLRPPLRGPPLSA